MTRIVGAVMLALAGVGTAALLTASSASAWDTTNIPNGYAVITDSSHAGCAGTYYIVNGNNIGCTADPVFGDALNAYIDSTICTVNPAADPGKCAPTTTTTATTTDAATTTTATSTATTTAQTTTAATTASTTTTAAPVQSAPTNNTAPATTTTTTPACDVQCQIDALNVRVTALETEQAKLVSILEAWPNIDPGILAALMNLGG